MRRFPTLNAFREEVGREIGVGDWITIDHAWILQFAQVCGDDSWVHVDEKRAARELPGGRPIAHGFLTLSLVTALGQKIWSVDSVGTAFLYGLESVRFAAPVPAGSRLRLHQVLEAIDDAASGGAKVRIRNTFEVEDTAKPACVAVTISVLFEDASRQRADLS